MAGREGAMLGPYRLTRRLGEGGAGEVYLAEGPTHAGMPGIAAVKVLHGPPGDAQARRIAEQAHAVGALHQTHVLPTYTVGEDQEALYVAMAYAPGGSLGAAVEASGAPHLRLPLGPGVVARLMTQIAQPLQTLHAQGFVHGDLKPTNLFVRTAARGGPLAAVADFGQAIVVSMAAEAAASGQNGWTTAALRCAAPEQLNGPPTAASDQYALATVAYLLLTGRYPFTGESLQLGLALLDQPPPPPTQLAPTLPAAAEEALLRALAKAPQARFPDVVSFARALSEGLAPAFAGKPGVTYELMALARAAPPTPRRVPTAGNLASGVPGGRRKTAPPAASDRQGSGSAEARALRRPPGTRQRASAVLAAALALAVLVVGGVGLRALATASAPQAALPNFQGLDYAPTPTPNPVQLAQQRQIAQAAEQLLANATSAPPVFSDSLASNSNHWRVDGRQSYFASDGRLHLYNQSPQHVLSVDQPVSAPPDLAVTVDITFVRGSFSDPAGLRLRVTPSATGPAAYYAVLISPEGRFEMWRFDGAHWDILAEGYAGAIVRGLGQTNHLAVLARGPRFWLYVNGHYVAEVRDTTLHGGADTMGPTVVYAGTEAAFAHYAVYTALP